VKFYPPGHELAGQNERSTPVVMQYTGDTVGVVWPNNIKTKEPTLPLAGSSPYAMR
jgi:branched-chain amino acid transport system substrate-binding protein